jgi:hypothetical protein
MEIFSDEILGLYTVEMLNYKKYLLYMLSGGMLSLAAGGSGAFMITAGLEKQNLHTQFIKALFLIVFSLWFIPFMGLKIVVILYVLSMLLVAVAQLLYIKKYIKVSPFSKELVILLIFTIIAMYFAINQHIDFKKHNFIIILGVSYVLFFLIMFKPSNKLLKDIVEHVTIF